MKTQLSADDIPVGMMISVEVNGSERQVGILYNGRISYLPDFRKRMGDPLARLQISMIVEMMRVLHRDNPELSVRSSAKRPVRPQVEQPSATILQYRR
jgi:hypothetical protein